MQPRPNPSVATCFVFGKHLLLSQSRSDDKRSREHHERRRAISSGLAMGKAFVYRERLEALTSPPKLKSIKSRRASPYRPDVGNGRGRSSPVIGAQNASTNQTKAAGCRRLRLVPRQRSNEIPGKRRT